MAASGIDRGVGGNNTSNESSTVMSPTSTIAAGSTGVLCIAADNAANTGTNFPTTSVTDSVGNVWVNRYNTGGSGGVNNNVERCMFVCDSLSTQLTSSNNITITYTAANVTAKCWTFIELLPGTAGNFWLFKLNATVSIQNAGTGSTVSIAASPGDMVVGMAAGESADTWAGDGDTTNGSWSTMQHTGVGTGATGMSIVSQYKINATTSANQSYNPTLTAADNGAAALLFTEVPPKARALFGGSTSEATTTVTFVKALSAGSIGVLCWQGANADVTGVGANTNLPATLTDTATGGGNTWTRRLNSLYDPGATNQGVELAIYTAPITNALAIGDTVPITYTLNNVALKTAFVLEFSDATGYAASGSGTGATSASPTVTSSSITYPDYIIGLCGIFSDNTFVADADTSNGSWSSPLTHTVSAGARTGFVQYKKVTGSGTQQFNPTVTSTKWMIGWAELTVPAPATGNTGAFLQFF